MKRFTMLNLILCLVFFCSCREEDPIEINNDQEFSDFVEEEMMLQDIPAVSVLIFNGEKIKYEQYFGKSDVENNVRLERDHLFLLASMSKTITGTAIMQLHERDSFELDDKVNDYLPFEVKVPNQATDITFRMLLTHTSGIADGSALDQQYYYGRDSPVDLGFFLRNYLAIGGQYYDALENFHSFEPGTEHEYSNIGTALIGLLVEEISGKNFNTYCKENIFIPLDMTNSFWRLDEINQPIAKPYDFGDSGFNQPIEHYTFTDYPNGGLRSNVNDMFHFLSAIAQEGVYKTNRILAVATVKKMVQTQIADLNDEMGLHFFIMNEQYGLWGHDGGEQGAATIMAYHPEKKIGAIILANQGDADLDVLLREAYKLGLSL